jgi:hypothetical protein
MFFWTMYTLWVRAFFVSPYLPKKPDKVKDTE